MINQTKNTNGNSPNLNLNSTSRTIDKPILEEQQNGVFITDYKTLCDNSYKILFKTIEVKKK